MSVNPLRAADEITRDEEGQIPTLTLLPITSEILRIALFKLLSYERALNSLSNDGFVFLLFFSILPTGKIVTLLNNNKDSYLS